MGIWVKKAQGLRSPEAQLQSSHRDVKYSTGKVVRNSVMNAHGARWAPETSGEYFEKCVIGHYAIPMKL